MPGCSSSTFGDMVSGWKWLWMTDYLPWMASWWCSVPIILENSGALFLRRHMPSTKSYIHLGSLSSPYEVLWGRFYVVSFLTRGCPQCPSIRAEIKEMVPCTSHYSSGSLVRRMTCFIVMKCSPCNFQVWTLALLSFRGGLGGAVLSCLAVVPVVTG